MNFGLLWLEALLVGLLWVAAWGAWIGRLRGWLIRGALWILIILIPLAALGAFVVAAVAIKARMGQERTWLAYALSLLVAYVVGALVLTYAGWRRGAGMRPAAAAWRRGGLALAWLVAVVMGYITLGNMDQAVRSRCALLSVKANSLYLATLPAIVSEDQNAGPLYEKVFARLKADPPNDVLNPPFGERDEFDPKEPATIAYLKRQADTIALLRRAAAMPACRFDWELMGPDIDRALGLGDMRNAANLLSLHAREAVARGEASEAIADTAALYGMSRQVGHSMLVSSLVGIGIDALGNKMLEMSLPAVKRPEELAGLRPDELPSLGRMLQQGLRGDERYGLMIYGSMPDMLKSWQREPMPGIDLIVTAPSVGGMFFRVFYLDVDAYVELMEKAQGWAVQPYYQIRGELPSDHGVERHGLMTSLIAPSLSAVFKTAGRVEAKEACGRVAVAMTRFRLDRGKLPEGLGELVPKYMEGIPADPFDGKPLRLAVKGDGRIIYSLGPDGVDDGGVEISGKEGKGDVIFTLKENGAATRP
jgi:hypothetical protein